MKLSKARATVVERGTYLHVDPRTGGRVESAHEWLVFPNNPAIGPMPMSQARTMNAETKAREDKRSKPERRVPAPTEPSPAPRPAPGPTGRTAGAIRSAEEARAMTVRHWTPDRRKS